MAVRVEIEREGISAASSAQRATFTRGSPSAMPTAILGATAPLNPVPRALYVCIPAYEDLRGGFCCAPIRPYRTCRPRLYPPGVRGEAHIRGC